MKNACVSYFGGFFTAKYLEAVPFCSLRQLLMLSIPELTHVSIASRRQAVHSGMAVFLEQKPSPSKPSTATEKSPLFCS